MLAEYLIERFDLGVQSDLHNLFQVLPNEGNDETRGLPTFSFGDVPGVPLIASSHRHFDSQFDSGIPVLFLSRNPYDVVVSNYFHKSKQWRGETAHLDLTGFVAQEARKLANYLNSWSSMLDSESVLHTTYESMSANPALELHRALSAFGLDAQDEIVQKAVERASFENMRQVEIRRGIAGHDYDRKDPEALRIRRGIIGGYRNYLRPEDIEAIDTVLAQDLTETAKADLWVTQY